MHVQTVTSSRPGSIPVPAIIDDLLNNFYPKLFSRWNDLEKKIQVADTCNSGAFRAISEKMTQELNSLHAKERLILFPFINQLYLLKQKSKSCSPFKKITAHHTALIHLCTELTAMLKQHSLPEAICADLVNDCGFFMKETILLNRIKQKFLFAPFKSCGTCRLDTKVFLTQQ